MKIFVRVCCAVAALSFSLLSASCKGAWDSEWVSARIENQSGETVRQMEVDYPSASFGADSVAAGSTLQYKFQIRGSGPIKITYTLSNGQNAHGTGPSVSDGQHGLVTIRILPQGKTQFVADLKPAS